MRLAAKQSGGNEFPCHARDFACELRRRQSALSSTWNAVENKKSDTTGAVFAVCKVTGSERHGTAIRPEAS